MTPCSPRYYERRALTQRERELREVRARLARGERFAMVRRQAA